MDFTVLIFPCHLFGVRFEIDVLRNLVASTAMRTADLLKKISNKTVEQRPLRLEDHFTRKYIYKKTK